MIDTRGGVGAIWSYPMGDVLGASAITDTGSAFYFNRIRAWAKVQSGFFVLPDSVVFDYYFRFVDGIGTVRAVDDTLLYARINGVEYGKPLRVVNDFHTSEIPNTPQLRVYPNPFHQRTHIEVDLKFKTSVEIRVVNLLGQTVCLLYSGILPIGRHQLVWDGDDGEGKKLGQGIYVIVLKSHEAIQTMKIIYLKSQGGA